MPRFQSIFPGEKYQKWTVLKRGQRQKYWLCQCECGTIKEVLGSNLRTNKTKTCGCGWKTWVPPNKLPDGEAAFNSIYSQYQHRAKQKNRKFELTKNQFQELIFQKCFYCHSDLTNFSHAGTTKINIAYNGIDRIDSSKGYSLDNCVSCCNTCNYLKNDLSLSEFFQQIALIYNIHIKKV